MSTIRPTAVINIVGLTQELLALMPFLKSFSSTGTVRKIKPVFPALTCSAQATYLTGLPPSKHGIVGNGWYFKELSQVMLWKQSNSLMQGEKLWEVALKRNPSFTTANLFWWFNMYSSVNFSVTPRPIYRADGLKLADIYSEPSHLRRTFQDDLGPFPLFNFWGPAADIRASRWIAQASARLARTEHPSLLLVYLPHLDYCLQKVGPGSSLVSKELLNLDKVCQELIVDLKSQGYQIVLLSEYGIQPVSGPIRINEAFRKRGWLAVREECGEDHFDAGASAVFSAVDHQIAHVYLRDPSKTTEVRTLLESLPGVSRVLDDAEKTRFGINHPRSGELIAVAKNDFWFSYRYWLDDRRAPDFARTVDIHRKPGYDPVELFLDRSPMTKVRLGARLLSKKLGFRYRMDVISLDDSLVKGSHGSTDTPPEYWPVWVSQDPDKSLPQSPIEATDVQELILNQLFEEPTYAH